MDPITAALIAAAAAGVTKIGESAISDAYTALKALIVRKFGDSSDVATAVAAVEAKPDSKGRQGTLQEEVVAAGANKDAELVQAAKALLEKIQAQPGGERVVQQITGDYNVQAAGQSTVNYNVPPKSE